MLFRSIRFVTNIIKAWETLQRKRHVELVCEQELAAQGCEKPRWADIVNTPTESEDGMQIAKQAIQSEQIYMINYEAKRPRGHFWKETSTWTEEAPPSSSYDTWHGNAWAGSSSDAWQYDTQWSRPHRTRGRRPRRQAQDVDGRAEGEIGRAHV